MANIYGTYFSEILDGTDEDDAIRGGPGNDKLNGYLGNDRLDGGIGIDIMVGGPGNDTYYVDHIGDIVAENEGEGIDVVRTTISYALDPGESVEYLVASNRASTIAMDLAGNELANTIWGNDGVNFMEGNAGDDALIGYGGNDLLMGGSGRDRLRGGEGNDIFVFKDFSRDRIYDFESGKDVIDLGWLMGPETFNFIGDAAFSGTPGEARFSNSLFQLDIDGDGLAELLITITGSLAASDFTFVAYGAWDY